MHTTAYMKRYQRLFNYYAISHQMTLCFTLGLEIRCKASRCYRYSHLCIQINGDRYKVSMTFRCIYTSSRTIIKSQVEKSLKLRKLIWAALGENANPYAVTAYGMNWFIKMCNLPRILLVSCKINFHWIYSFISLAQRIKVRFFRL